MKQLSHGDVQIGWASASWFLMNDSDPKKGGRCMYASVRRYQALDAEALLRKVEEEFVERLKTVEGFVGYYVIDGADGTVTSVTIGETEEAVEASTVLAKEWVVERAAHLVASAPDLTTGEVRVRAER